jgi:hypothetical protein
MAEEKDKSKDKTKEDDKSGTLGQKGYERTKDGHGYGKLREYEEKPTKPSKPTK